MEPTQCQGVIRLPFIDVGLTSGGGLQPGATINRTVEDILFPCPHRLETTPRLKEALPTQPPRLLVIC